MALTILEGNRVMEYAHRISPLKYGSIFLPNFEKFELIRKTSNCNILRNDFERHQRAGKTILINRMGGWCFQTSDMEIVAVF